VNRATAAAVVVLAVLLAGTVAAGSTVVGAERTVLDAGYVTGTLAATDGYDDVRGPVTASVREGLSGGEDPVAEELPPGIEFQPFDREAFADAAVAEAFGPDRIDRTIEGVYGYLHGRRGPEALTVSLEPVKAAYAERVTREAITIDAAALVDVGGGTDGPVQVDRTTVERLRANESSYRATRAEFRDSLPAGTDREALGERTKADLEPAIEDATAEEDSRVTDAVIEIQFATVDALTGDLEYDTYRSRLDDAEADLRTVAGERVRERIDGAAPSAVTIGADGDVLGSVDDLAGPVRTLDLLVWVLPIAALGVIALLFALTRSIPTTARTVGAALLGAAVVCLAVAVLSREVIVGRLGQAIGGDFGAIVGPLVDGFLDAIVVQSLVLATVGIAFLALVWADRRGRLDGVRDAIGLEPAASGSGSALDDPDRAGDTEATERDGAGNAESSGSAESSESVEESESAEESG